MLSILQCILSTFVVFVIRTVLYIHFGLYLYFEFCTFKLVSQNNMPNVDLMRSLMADWYRWHYSSATDCDRWPFWAPTSAECKEAFCTVTYYVELCSGVCQGSSDLLAYLGELPLQIKHFIDGINRWEGKGRKKGRERVGERKGNLLPLKCRSGYATGPT